MKVIADPNQVDRNKWSEFVYTHPHGNIFQSPEMYDVYSKSELVEPAVIFALDVNNSIIGLLQAVIQKEYKSVLGIISARSIVWGGPLIKSDDKAAALLLVIEYNKIIRNKAIYTQFRNLNDISCFHHELTTLGYNYEDHLDIHIDLTKSEVELWSELHSKRRNEIRRAKKEGIVLMLQKDEISLQQSYEILKEVYNRAKLPLPKYDLIKNLLYTEDAEFKLLNFTAVHEGKIIGCMLVLAYKKVLYDFFAGSYQAFYKKYPNDLIPWEIFIWGKMNDYELFDFGGAGKPNIPYGVREYKLKFGGELVNYGRYEKIHKPLLYQFAKVGLSIWQKLK